MISQVTWRGGSWAVDVKFFISSLQAGQEAFGKQPQAAFACETRYLRNEQKEAALNECFLFASVHDQADLPLAAPA